MYKSIVSWIKILDLLSKKWNLNKDIAKNLSGLADYKSNYMIIC